MGIDDDAPHPTASSEVSVGWWSMHSTPLLVATWYSGKLGFLSEKQAMAPPPCLRKSYEPYATENRSRYAGFQRIDVTLNFLDSSDENFHSGSTEPRLFCAREQWAHVWHGSTLKSSDVSSQYL